MIRPVALAVALGVVTLTVDARAEWRDVGLGASYGLRWMQGSVSARDTTTRFDDLAHAASLLVRPSVLAAYMGNETPDDWNEGEGPRVPHPWVRLTLYGAGAGASARGFELSGGAEFGIAETPLTWSVDLLVARRAFDVGAETIPVWSWLNLGAAIHWRPANWVIVSAGARFDPALLAIFGLFSSDPGLAATSQLASSAVDGLDVSGFARAGLSHVFGVSSELFVVAEASYQANLQRDCRLLLATTGLVAGVTF